MRAQHRLYLTADKKRLVPEGHADAATLYASPGDEIPDSAAELFGLVDGALPDGDAPTKPTKAKPVKANGEDKSAKPPATKEAPAGEDKSEGSTPPASETKGE